MLQVEDDYVDYSAPSFSTNRLAYLIEIEKVSSNLLSLGKELKAKEEKRVKYKDLLSNSNKHIGSDISDLDLEIRVIVEKDSSR